MSTAAEFRQRRRAPKSIIVKDPGSDLTIECRRPDLIEMAFSGLMAWPALDRVRALMAERQEAETAASVLDNRPQPTLVDRARAAGTFLDEWVCLAAIAPRVVMAEHEALADPAVLWIEDVPFEVRQAIYQQTFRAPTTAGADFRGDESGVASPGQGGEAVRDEALVAVGSDGSDGGARP